MTFCRRRTPNGGTIAPRDRLMLVANSLGKLVHFYSIVVGSGKREAALESGNRLLGLIELKVVVRESIIDVRCFRAVGVQSESFATRFDCLLMPAQRCQGVTEIVVKRPIIR
jgi:hypothetical protein